MRHKVAMSLLRASRGNRKHMAEKCFQTASRFHGGFIAVTQEDFFNVLGPYFLFSVNVLWVQALFA